MKLFFTILISGLLSVMALNYYVDPANRWWRGSSDNIEKWPHTAEEGLIAPPDFDERKFKREQIAVVPKPKLVIFGSSRVMVIDAKLFPKEQPLYNIGMGAANVYDFVSMWQRLKDTDKIPKHIIIFLDPWVVGEERIHSEAWRTNFDLYKHFTQSMQYSMGSKWLEDMIEPLHKLGIEASALLSWEITKISLKNVFRHKISHDKDNWKIVKLKDVRIDQAVYLADGSVYNPPEADVRLQQELLHTKSFRNTSHYQDLVNWQIHSENYSLFLLLLKDIHEKNVMLDIIVPPFAIGLYKEISLDPGLQNFTAPFFKILTQLQEQELIQRACDAFIAEKFGCHENEFRDAIHMLHPCAKKVIDRCGF